MRDLFVNIVRFIGLVLFQVLVLNNLNISSYMNPYIYPLFILLLPINTPVWLVLILSFVTGITVDMFSNTMGIHAAALVLMGFARGMVLNVLVPRTGYEMDMDPKLGQFGFNWFLTYAIILVAVHHIALFMLEVFSFEFFAFTLQKILVSILFSVFLMLLYEFLFYDRKKRV